MPTDEIVVQLTLSNHLIVWDVSQANLLYNSGFYGRPLGISKPREKFTEPLILDPVEGIYLAELGCIRVVQDGKYIPPNQLLNKFNKLYPQINQKYRVYEDLRNKGFVITPGIKYGCDFTVYEDGPGIDHAPYIVQIQKYNEKISASDIVKAGRLATTVRKAFVLAVLNGDIQYIEFNWWKA
jgi:tRNA-intron endonuclease